MTEYAGPKTGSPTEEGLGGMGEAEGRRVCVCVFERRGSTCKRVGSVYVP